MVRHALLLFVIVLLVGCDKDPDGFRRAGQRVGESVTDFAKGVGTGVDSKLEVPVELAEPVSSLGLRITVAKTSGIGEAGPKKVTVYLLSSKPVKEWLRAKAINAAGAEIGRATTQVELAAEDAKYVTFAFDQELDTQSVVKYVVEIGKAVPPEPGKPDAEPGTRKS